MNKCELAFKGKLIARQKNREKRGIVSIVILARFKIQLHSDNVGNTLVTTDNSFIYSESTHGMAGSTKIVKQKTNKDTYCVRSEIRVIVLLLSFILGQSRLFQPNDNRRILQKAQLISQPSVLETGLVSTTKWPWLDSIC